MIETINIRALELYHRVADWVREERGQTTSEYVAVTAVGVALAIGVIYTALEGSLTTAVGDIGDAITDFVTAETGGGGS